MNDDLAEHVAQLLQRVESLEAHRATDFSLFMARAEVAASRAQDAIVGVRGLLNSRDVLREQLEALEGSVSALFVELKKVKAASPDRLRLPQPPVS